MKKILTGLVLLSTVSVFGQGSFVGLNGGIGLTNVSADKIFNDVEARTGYHLGMNYEYEFNSSLHLKLGAQYDQKGFKSLIIFTDEMGVPTGETAATKMNYDYLTIPVTAGINVGSKLRGQFDVGVFTSLPIKAESITPQVENLESETFDVLDKVSKLDFGGMLEFGGNYEISEGIRLVATAGYRKSLTTFTNSDYFESAIARHNGIVFSVGLKYKLKN